MNFVIVGALVVQALVGQASRLAGAVVGFVITTGILLWGLGAYAQGGAITFFGLELSQGVFVALCLIWYGFNWNDLQKARSAPAAPQAQG